jgi:hypothetical protein
MDDRIERMEGWKHDVSESSSEDLRQSQSQVDSPLKLYRQEGYRYQYQISDIRHAAQIFGMIAVLQE